MAEQGEHYPPLPSKPPNKVQHEKACQRLQNLITEREEERRRLSAEARKERELIAIVREERDILAGERTNIFAQLDKINKEVSKKAESVQKLRAGLPSANADLIDSQIRRLEEQINKGHFKLAEERRLVAETDRLRRSRRTLKEWQVQREELEGMRGEQKIAREAREHWFRASKAARMKEEDARAVLREVIERLEASKAALEDLRDKRRHLVAEFRAQDAEWRKEVERKREIAKRKEEEERRIKAEEKEKEEREEREKAEPFLAERRLVVLLQQYCSRLASPSTPSSPITTTVTGPNLLLPTNTSSTIPSMLLAVPAGSRRRSSGFSCVSTGSSTYATPLCHTPNNIPSTPTCGSPPDPSGGVFSRKASIAEADVAHALGKRGKREARRRRSSAAQLRKVLAHNPETYAQFQSLGLSPPLIIGGVAEAQARLQEKMEELEHKAAMVKLSRLSVQQEATGINSELSLVPEVCVLPEVHVGPQVTNDGVVPVETDESFQLQKAPIKMKTLQESFELGNVEKALPCAASVVNEESSIMFDTFDLKPETQCDTLDLANGSEEGIKTRKENLQPESECNTLDLATSGCDNIPAILLSPASNEGTEIEENLLQDEQTLGHHCNNEEETENTKDNVQLAMQNNGDKKRDNSSPEERSPNVGPIIKVTDCDTEKSNSSGLIAASCIIAR